MNNLMELIPQFYIPITLPYSKQEIQIRSYTHNDAKQLLRAHEEAQSRKKDKGKVILTTLQQLIAKCIKEDIEVNKLNIADFIYVMMYINSISKESSSELVFKCSECQKKKTFMFDINECVIKNEENKNNVVIPRTIPRGT